MLLIHVVLVLDVAAEIDSTHFYPFFFHFAETELALDCLLSGFFPCFLVFLDDCLSFPFDSSFVFNCDVSDFLGSDFSLSLDSLKRLCDKCALISDTTDFEADCFIDLLLIEYQLLSKRHVRCVFVIFISANDCEFL